MLTTAFTISDVNAAGSAYDSLGVLKDAKLWATLGEETKEIIDTSIVSSASTITMDFNFRLEDGVDYRGKTTSFTLPLIFRESSILADLDIVHGGVVIGQLRKVPGTSTVNLTFANTEYLINNSNINGVFKINANFEKSIVTETKRYPIEFGDIYKKDVAIFLEPDWETPDTIYVWKHGEIKPTEGIVVWTISVPIFQDVTNVVIKDTHSEGQIVDYSSFQARIVYAHDGSPNLPLDLSIDKTSTNSFSINLGALYYEGSKNNGKPVSSEVHAEKRDAVLMRYNTIITDDHDFYKNHVEITANEVSEMRSWDAVVKNVGGSIVGETKSINIIKYDNHSHQKLEGAIFNLEKLNPSSNEWYTIKENIEVINSNGLQVDKLTFGTYRVIETKAPIGYILYSTPSVPFTIDASTNQILEIKIFNEQKIFEILVKKSR